MFLNAYFHSYVNEILIFLSSWLIVSFASTRYKHYADGATMPLSVAFLINLTAVTPVEEKV